MYNQRKTRDPRDRKRFSERKAKTYQRRLTCTKEQSRRKKAPHVTHHRKVLIHKYTYIWYDEDVREDQSVLSEGELCGDNEEPPSMEELEPDSGGIWPPLDSIYN